MDRDLLLAGPLGGSIASVDSGIEPLPNRFELDLDLASRSILNRSTVC